MLFLMHCVQEIIGQKVTGKLQIALWQQELLQKLGFTPIDKKTDKGPQEGSPDTFSRPRVFLRSPARSGSGSSSTSQNEPAVVDPRLLAAVRLITPGMTVKASSSSATSGAITKAEEGSSGAQSSHQQRVCALTQDQLGDWELTPLGVAHELVVLGVIKDLCLALYTSLGTTLQQDKALQYELEQTCAKMIPGVEGNDAIATSDSLISVLVNSVPEKDVSRDVLLAVQLRLSVKRCLEEALKAVMKRSKGMAERQNGACQAWVSIVSVTNPFSCVCRYRTFGLRLYSSFGCQVLFDQEREPALVSGVTRYCPRKSLSRQ